MYVNLAHSLSPLLFLQLKLAYRKHAIGRALTNSHRTEASFIDELWQTFKQVPELFFVEMNEARLGFSELNALYVKNKMTKSELITLYEVYWKPFYDTYTESIMHVRNLSQLDKEYLTLYTHSVSSIFEEFRRTSLLSGSLSSSAFALDRLWMIFQNAPKLQQPIEVCSC